MSTARDQIVSDVLAIVGGDHAVDAVWSPSTGPAEDVRGVLTELPETAGGGIADHTGMVIEFVSAEIGGIAIGDLLEIETVLYTVTRVEDVDTWGVTTVALHN